MWSYSRDSEPSALVGQVLSAATLGLVFVLLLVLG